MCTKGLKQWLPVTGTCSLGSRARREVDPLIEWQYEERRTLARARADIYRFLTQLFSGPPTAELLATLAQPEFQEHLQAVFGAAADAFLEAIAAGLDADALRQEYNALFRVPGERYLCPYESVYRGRRVVDDRVINGAMWGPWTRDVQRFHKLAGVALTSAAGGIPDFVGVELEFMHFLYGQEADAWSMGDQPQAERYADLRQQFLSTHLACWLGSLCDEMRARAREKFYVGLAEMAKAFVAAEIAG